jgi:hypothetical protein
VKAGRRSAAAIALLKAIVHTAETEVDAADVPAAVGVIADAVGAAVGLAAEDGTVADAAGRAAEDTNFFATDLRGFTRI